MINPIIWPITLYDGDDFDFQLNWRERCGPTFALATYNARMTFWPTKTDRSAFIYQITDPISSGEGIALQDTSPNIRAHITYNHVAFDPAPKWYILELKGTEPIDITNADVWFRLAMGDITYIL